MIAVHLKILGDATIIIGNEAVTPRSPHLFGLALYLLIERDRAISRQHLQSLLFSEATRAASASHSVRQLVYRLRKLGLNIEEHSTGLRIGKHVVSGPLDFLSSLDERSRDALQPEVLRVLPSYAPRLAPAFSDWLDRTKDIIEGQLRKQLVAYLRRLRDRHSWASVVKIGKVLGVLDPLDEEVVCARAEGLALNGLVTEAVELLDGFIRDWTAELPSVEGARRLRARITKLPIQRRPVSLRGREECLSFLQSEWQKATSVGGQLSVVVGHSGIGKTRVAEEFSTRTLIDRARVVLFSCDGQSRQRPLALFSHILPELRALRGSLGASPDYRNALARVDPKAGTRPGDVDALDGFNVAAIRAEIQLALIDLLEAVCNEQPLLLVIDDAHLLDEASCSVVRALSTTQSAPRVHVVACVRPSHDGLLIQEANARCGIHRLAPLSATDSREMVLEIRDGRTPDEAHVSWCVNQAGGNPFYLYTLALQGQESSLALPFDISSLAARSYLTLREVTQSVLEACLLLGRWATLDRVLDVAGVDDNDMLSALRELEDQDLIRLVDGLLQGPHAILCDGVRALVPSTVSGLLHRRIAVRLEGECVADGFTSSLAWAAAQSWIAAGDPSAASRLLRQCATHAASVGEPAAAAELLWQLNRTGLPLSLQADLLDDVVRYSEAGGCRQLAVDALTDRMRIAKDVGEGDRKIEELAFHIIEAQLLNGAPLKPNIAPLYNLLSNESADSSLRVNAAVRLMIIADVELDVALAENVRSSLESIAAKLNADDLNVRRAELVYHTTFGDLQRAHGLAIDLLSEFSEPSILETSMRARTFAAFALYRLRDSLSAGRACEQTFEFMSAHGVLSEAVYAASLRTEIAIADGEFEIAREWLLKSRVAARSGTPHQVSPNSGFYANAGVLAMRDGRYDEAEDFLLFPLREYAILSAARYRAVSIALSLRLRQLRGDDMQGCSDLPILSSLFARGRNLGGQDAVVEALWCALMLNGETHEASKLLSDYLTIHRRERSQPEWSLRNTTAADDAWLSYAPSRAKTAFSH